MHTKPHAWNAHTENYYGKIMQKFAIQNKSAINEITVSRVEEIVRWSTTAHTARCVDDLYKMVPASRLSLRVRCVSLSKCEFISKIENIQRNHSSSRSKQKLLTLYIHCALFAFSIEFIAHFVCESMRVLHSFIISIECRAHNNNCDTAIATITDCSVAPTAG